MQVCAPLQNPHDPALWEPGGLILWHLIMRFASTVPVLPNLMVHCPCRFVLLCKIRTTRLFGSLEGRQALVSIRLLAFYVLVQSTPSQEEVASFFANEPEFVGELVSLLQAEKQVPEPIRVLALRALAVQVSPASLNHLRQTGGHVRQICVIHGYLLSQTTHHAIYKHSQSFRRVHVQILHNLVVHPSIMAWYGCSGPFQAGRRHCILLGCTIWAWSPTG